MRAKAEKLASEPGSKPESKDDLKSLPMRLLAKQPPVDLTPQIAARAYELYQERVHGKSQQDQDWIEAERETRKDQAEHPRIA